MTRTIRLLGVTRELAGVAELRLELAPAATVADLRTTLATTVPALAPTLPSCAVALEHRYCADDVRIDAFEGEITLVPPVSGG